MNKKWPLLAIGLLATFALIAAACTPASEDDTPEPVATTGGQVDTGGDTPPTATPTMDDDDDDMDDDMMMSHSVSGKPLDPDVVLGGVLQAAATGDGPTFSNWEEAAGIPDDAIQPLSNMLVQPRTWGTLEDFRNNAFFEVHPDLAADWEISDDGLDYIFNLRDGLEWSDGTAITCADIKWSYDTIRTGEGLRRSPRAVHFKAIDEITCPDDLTVVFTLEYPKPAMLEVIAQPYNVIRPAHIYKTMLETEGNLDGLRQDLPDVTSGPFVIEDYIPGERYLFQRNENYWDEPLPYLDGVEVNILTSSAQVSAIRGGRLDVGAKQGWDRGRADTLLRECGSDTCQFWPRLIASSFSPAIMPHHDREPWSNPAVKEAIALAIDNYKYIDTVTLGYAVAPTGCGFYPTGEWAMPQDRCSAIPGMADIYGDSAADRLAASEADKERAKALLAEAGIEPGLDVTVRFWSVIQDNVPPIIGDLQEIGLNAEAEVLETARAYDAWTNGDFDIGVHSFWIAGLDPDVTLYEHFYTGSDRNYNRYSNVEFDNLVDQMSQTLDQAERKELAWQAMELALSEVGKVVGGHGSYVPTFNARVQGLMPAVNYLAGYGPQSRYDHAWLSDAGS
jgi:peptide/nickel transport system substrate-binding protein